MELPKVEPVEIETKDGQKIKVVKQEDFEKVTSTFTTVAQELEKEKKKDKNFAALRAKKLSEMSEEERNALSEEKRMFLEEREEFRKEVDEIKAGQLKSWKDKALNDLGLDEEEQKKVLMNFDRLRDPEDSESAIAQKMRVAYSIAIQRPLDVGERRINSAIPFSGAGAPKKGKEDFTDTEAGKALAKRLGINLEQPKK